LIDFADFSEFVWINFRFNRFRVNRTQFMTAMQILEEAGPGPFLPDATTRATGHPNIPAILAGLRRGGVLERIRGPPKRYRFNTDFCQLVKTCRIQYLIHQRKEKPKRYINIDSARK
jgi:hypothetical protein